MIKYCRCKMFRKKVILFKDIIIDNKHKVKTNETRMRAAEVLINGGSETDVAVEWVREVPYDDVAALDKNLAAMAAAKKMESEGEPTQV